MSSSSALHVILVGNYAHDRSESMQRYADMVAGGLSARGVSVELLKPLPFLGRLKPAASGAGKWLGYIDKFLLFPFVLRRTVKRAQSKGARVVVHICDHSNAMYTGWLQRVPHVVTCHDLLAVRSALGHFPQNRVGWAGRLLQRWIVRGLRRSVRIVCDSDATRKDLLALGGIAPLATATLPIGLNYPYGVREASWVNAQLAGLPAVGSLGMRGYIFHIGGSLWYKNRAGVLRIYFAYVKQGGRLPLVMAGKSWSADLEQLLADQPEGAAVIRLGNVSNERLNALYGQAACLLFPSFYEGFGWPVLEALASGCPVVCSHRASLPEVGGEAVVYIDPADEEVAAARMLEMLAESPGALERRRNSGLAQASKFSNDVMLDQLIVQYGHAAGA